MKYTNKEKLKYYTEKGEEYLEANKEYIHPDAFNYTPNVCSRNNARLNRMEVCISVYQELIKKVEKYQGLVERAEDRPIIKIKKEELKNKRLPIGTIINTGYRLEGYQKAKIIKIFKNSYKVEYKNKETAPILIELINTYNK